MALLEIRNLTHHFGGLCALNGVDLRLEEGELMGLIGPNGAGKTTVFNLVCGVYRPVAGQILFGGKSLIGLPPHRISGMGVARTFQNIRLWNNMTVLDNLAIAQHGRLGYGFAEIFLETRRYREREKAIAGRAREILELLKLEHLRDELPRNLPYGLQRRVEIGRALALRPKLILLDEPAAGLNAGEVTGLMELIRWICREFNMTILMIEHQMKVVMNICSRIQVLDFGETIAEGGPEEIRNNPRVVSAYLGTEVHN